MTVTDDDYFNIRYDRLRFEMLQTLREDLRAAVCGNDDGELGDQRRMENGEFRITDRIDA